MTPLPVFFGDEWDRFKQGLSLLDPKYSDIVNGLSGQGQRPPGEPGTITIPGWDQIIKLGPRPQLTPEQWREFYKAQREGREPNLPPELVAEAIRYQAALNAMRTSAQPGWLKAWGQILTAIDNVQDFASTLATLGRLGLWAAPKLGTRFVPVVGWIILAADILNTLNFLGMVAMPLYGLLCRGPREAILAGLPAMVLKNALCREVWTMTMLNPFSKKARLKRAGKALGKLPGIGNLIEVAQTTDNLFGYGLGIGPLYGMLMEAVFSLSADPGKYNTVLQVAPQRIPFTSTFINRAEAMTRTERYVNLQAARVLRDATPIVMTHDDLDEATHGLGLVALLGAIGTVAPFFEGVDRDELLSWLLEQTYRAPDSVSPHVAGMLGDVSPAEAGVGRWWIEGAPVEVRGADLVEALAPRITAATGAFFTPRRNRPEAAFFGACYNTLAETSWVLATGSTDNFHTELSTDFKILTGLAVDGILLPIGAPEGPVWAWWRAMRAAVEAGGGRLLEHEQVEQLARHHNVPIVRLLAPDAPFPPEWAEWAGAVDVHDHGAF